MTTRLLTFLVLTADLASWVIIVYCSCWLFATYVGLTAFAVYRYYRDGRWPRYWRHSGCETVLVVSALALAVLWQSTGA